MKLFLQNIQSSIFLLKGKILEALDNQALASECFKRAIHVDVYCFEAFESMIKHQMLTYAEEEELLSLLPISEQCNSEEGEVLYTLYRSKLKKYHACKSLTFIDKVKHGPKSNSLMVTENNAKNIESKQKNEKMNVDLPEPTAISKLNKSLDVIVSKAELLYYNCDYNECYKLTDNILKHDPYHMYCLPIHISCLVELKMGNSKFYFVVYEFF